MAVLVVLICTFEVWVRFILFFREAESKHCFDIVAFLLQQNV